MLTKYYITLNKANSSPFTNLHIVHILNGIAKNSVGVCVREMGMWGFVTNSLNHQLNVLYRDALRVVVIPFRNPKVSHLTYEKIAVKKR